MNTTHTAVELNFLADFALLDGDDEFMVRGRYSLTCMLRTLAALNADLSSAEFIRMAGLAGVNPVTARIQFAASRAVSLEFGDCTLNADGSLADKTL